MLKVSILGLGIKVAGAAVAFLSNVMIANYLGADQSGYYYYLISFLGIATSVAIFGGQTYILKVTPVLFTSGEDRKAAQVIIGVAARTLLFAVILLAVLLTIVWRFNNELPELLAQNPTFPYLVSAVPFLAVNVVLSHALQVQGRVVLSFFTSGLSHSICYVMAIALFRPDNSETLSAIYLIISFIIFLHLVFLNYRRLKIGSVRKGLDGISVRPSSQFFVVQIGFELLVQSPVLLLGIVGTSPAEVSGYAIASRVALMLSFIYAVVNRIVLPRFSDNYSKGQWSEMQRDFVKAVAIMSAVALPVALVFLFFATPILMLFGDEFAGFSQTFFVLVLHQSLNLVTGPAGNLLIMTDRQNLFRNLVVIGLTLVLVASWVLIPRYDAFGAALAILLGYGFVNLSSLVAACLILKKRKET